MLTLLSTRLRLLLAALVCLAASTLAAQHRPAPKAALARPNVILINMDDMGYGDTEPFGMTGIATPNFNRVAQQGTRFTHFNAGQPICTASRAALLTGCYPTRVGMSGVLLPTDHRALNPQEATIASLLKQAGYRTGMFGKWHLGNKAPYFPLHYGFDEFAGLPYSLDIWPVDYDGFTPVTDPKDYRSTFPPLPLLEGDRVVDTIRNLNEAARLTTLFTERSVAFIKANKARPFFLYLAHPLPHVPLAVSAKFKGKSELGLFGDVIMELDWSLGQILKTLDDEKLAANTLLIVTSDNGPWLSYGDHAGSSGGFREGKSTTWEGGNRVPLLVRWPGHTTPGDVNSQLLTNMDLLPTIVAATGAARPKNQIDGLSFLPLLTGRTKTGPREVFYYYFGTPTSGLEAVRYRHWKLVLPHAATTYTQARGTNGRPAPGTKVPVPLALYDLAHDPGEIYDVQQNHPDLMQRMLGLAEQARADLGDDLTKRTGSNVRSAAHF